MSIVFKTTHVAEGLAGLIEQFKNKPNLVAFLTSYLEEIQEFETAAQTVSLLRDLDTAADAQLDGLGEIVDQKRGDLSDTDYRAYIRARILINNSGGTGDDIIKVITALITGAVLTFDIQELFPAGFKIVFSGTFGTLGINIVAQAIGDAKLAGVAAHVEYSPQLDADTFTFASGDTAEASATQGFGNDAGTTGGAFSDVIEA